MGSIFQGNIEESSEEYETIFSGLKEISTEIKNKIQHHAEEHGNDVDKLIESQNGVVESQNCVVDSLNHLVDKQGEVQHILTNQTQQMSQKVAHSEHISHKVRGQLGAQERKRRKVDLEEIGRLRAELGVCKRQHRDNDRVVAALGECVASMDEKMQTLIDLVRTIAERGN